MDLVPGGDILFEVCPSRLVRIEFKLGEIAQVTLTGKALLVAEAFFSFLDICCDI